MNVSGLLVNAFVAVLIASPALNAGASTPGNADHRRIYAGLTGATVLENQRVAVQRFIIQPGQSTGFHTHFGSQLLVFVKGGVLTLKAGRSAVWPDGRVVWQDDKKRGDAGSTNTGAAPIELLWITLKPRLAAAVATAHQPSYAYLNYPNLPGEDVLENNQVIVQRFKMNPGQWEGVHAHNPNTFYIFIKGGQWLSKSKQHPEGVPGFASDGLVAWMDTIDISDQHQSGNIGSNSADVVWVSLKQ